MGKRDNSTTSIDPDIDEGHTSVSKRRRRKTRIRINIRLMIS